MNKIIRNKFQCVKDKLVIRGLVFKKDLNNMPVVIISHGFMANYKSVIQHAKYFANLGYAAFIYDFCGGSVIGRSDGSTTEMSVLTEVDDLKTVIDYVCKLPYVNYNDITLVGCSQGGFVSAITAAQLTDKIKKLVLFYPALSIPDDARKGHMMFAKFDPKNIPDTFYCGPMKLGRIYPEDVIDINPYQLITKYLGDVVIIHGTKDSIVNVSYSEKAFHEYLNREKGSVKLHLINKADHIFTRKQNKIAFDLINNE